MSEDLSPGDNARQACLAVVPEVLETMFFEVLEGAPGAGALSDGGLLGTSGVDFEGSARGQLVVADADAEAQTFAFADAFLALEDRDERTPNAGLVLGERANIVCGNALGRWQPNGIFRLSTPVTQLGRPAEELNEPGLVWLRFPLLGGPLFVRLTLEVIG
jgi:hypothetical protein